MANAIVLYTHPDCSFSDALKDELDTAGTEYDEINLALRPEAWLDLEKLTGGRAHHPRYDRGRRSQCRLPRRRLKLLAHPEPLAPTNTHSQLII